MKLGRRTMLRGMLGGAAVALGLPLLDAMRNGNGDAHADGLPLPKRFGVFFWANGLPWHAAHDPSFAGHPDLWTPSKTGPGWDPSPLLEPLRGIHDRVTVVTGLEPHTSVPDSPPGQGDGHMRGAAVALTSDRPRSEGFDHEPHIFAFNRATLDQVIAEDPGFSGPAGVGTKPRFKSLELATSKALFHDYGHWCAISHSGPDKLNPPIYSAKEAFGRVFGAPTDAVLAERRASLLDAVNADAKRLKAKVGAHDKVRIDAHLDHVNELQDQLRAHVAACVAPAVPGERSEDLIGELTAQAKVLAVALQCDLVRSFSVMFTSPATNHVFNEFTGHGMHAACHGGEWDAVKNITLTHMRGFRAFLDVLAAANDEAGGSILDSSLVYATSEYGEGYQHHPQEHPVLLAGSARGALKTGRHVRLPGDNLSRAHLTILRALGIAAPSYGFDGGETSDPLPGLLA